MKNIQLAGGERGLALVGAREMREDTLKPQVWQLADRDDLREAFVRPARAAARDSSRAAARPNTVGRISLSTSVS